MDYPKSDPTARLLNDKFTDGDPVNGVPASRDSADYQNMVFDEILSVIQLAGLTPDEGDLTQLWEAIMQMVLAEKVPETSSAEALAGSAVAKFMPPDLVHAAFNQFGLGKVKSESSDANNLVKTGFYVLSAVAANHPPFTGAYVFVSGNGSTGATQIAISVVEADKIAFRKLLDGTWSAWRELYHSANLPKASSAVALAGTDDAAFMTAMRVHEVLNNEAPASLSQDGWAKLPNGLVVQWGVVSDDWATKTFPVAFPNACFGINCTWISDSTGGGGSSAFVVSNSQFRVRAGTGSNSGENIFWFAVGH